MRDAHRMREKYDLSLDSRQVVSLLIGGIVVLGAVFVLGVLVGKKLAGAPHADRGPDLLTALDHKSDALERARAAPPLTFQEELTRPTPPAPTVVRPPATAPATAASTVARAPSTPAASAIAPAATPVATVVKAPAATGPTTASATPAPASGTSSSASSKPVATVAKPPAATAPATPAATAAPGSAPSSSASSKPAASGRATPAPTVAAVDPKSEAARPAHTESVATRTAPAAAHAAPKVPEVTSATGAFTLQLGASPSRDDAERQASRLREKGYAPYIVSAEVPGKGTWYRVRMGSFPTKDAATRYLQDFKRETQAEAFVASTR